MYREDISNIQLNCGIEFFQFSNTSLVHVNSTQLDDDQEKRRKKEKVDCCVPPPVRRVGGSDEEGSLSSAAAAAATATAASTRFIYRMTGILPCLLLSSL